MLRTMNHLQITGQCCQKRWKSACPGEWRNWQKSLGHGDKILPFWIPMNEIQRGRGVRREIGNLGLDLFVNCILKMISFTQMLLWICCPDMAMGGKGWGTLMRTHSLFLLPFFLLPSSSMIALIFLTICWLIWMFSTWYFSHSMARFSFSIQIQCSLMLLPNLFLFKMASFYYTALHLPQVFCCCFNSWFAFFLTYTLDLCYVMNGHWDNDLDQLFCVAVSRHNTRKHIFPFSFSTPSLLPLLLLQGKYPENSKSFSWRHKIVGFWRCLKSGQTGPSSSVISQHHHSTCWGSKIGSS